MGTGPKKGKTKEQDASVYQSTVNLPQTQFGAPGHKGGDLLLRTAARLPALDTALGARAAETGSGRPDATHPFLPVWLTRLWRPDLRANSKVKEPQLQKWWHDNQTYQRCVPQRGCRGAPQRRGGYSLRLWERACTASPPFRWSSSHTPCRMCSLASENTGEAFTLHDGPPYANGDLHMGAPCLSTTRRFILMTDGRTASPSHCHQGTR